VEIPVVVRYLGAFLENEVIPTLTEIPGHPASLYAATVLERLTNTGVRDQIARLCIDGTAKFPKFLIPTVETQIERGGPVECAALALAGWARYLATVPASLRAPDASGERALELAQDSIANPLAFLELDEVFPPRLRTDDRFRSVFARAASDLVERGPLDAIRYTLDAQGVSP
jgi:mannitol 2-dehydrogenase